MDKLQGVSIKQLERYPIYLKYLKNLKNSGEVFVFSWMLSKEFNISEEQVRKDFQVVSQNKGLPKIGRPITQLINDIESFLGYNDVTNAIIVGSGRLGQALLNYEGFEKLGLNILAAFDINPSLIGKTICGKTVFSIDKLENLTKRLGVHIAIIATPSDVSVEIAQRLINSGVQAIWNFAPVYLSFPNVIVENVNLASSLAVLSHKLKNLNNNKK